MLRIAISWLQFSASGQIDPNFTETGTKNNTKRIEHTTLGKATDGSIAKPDFSREIPDFSQNCFWFKV
jgi:hypothetical protein